jgi:feruloyl-CoA synthase
MRATGPDTIVKFLFTSGSTNLPKAVITTQRMLCANQQQILQSMPILGQEPPVLVDWMPWNHTAGGNHNFFMALYNGGTLYIDEGKPTPALLGETLRNLREVAPTWYFNVPIGYEAITRAMDTDPQLRRNFYARLSCQLYSGAALSQAIQDALHRHAEAALGERVVMTAGLGMTESSPFALFVTSPHTRAGEVGLPAAGLEVKLPRSAKRPRSATAAPTSPPATGATPKRPRRPLTGKAFSAPATPWPGSTRPTPTWGCASTAARPKTSSWPPAPLSASARCGPASWAPPPRICRTPGSRG